MWVCSASSCRSDDTPQHRNFYGNANVTLNHWDEVIEMPDGSENVHCCTCDSSAIWCDYCESDYYCDEHSPENNVNAETVVTDFSEVPWATKV